MFRAVLSALVVVLAAACGTPNPLYCDEDTPCMDSYRPFCDLHGEYPESEGIRNTCIAPPFDAPPSVIG